MLVSLVATAAVPSACLSQVTPVSQAVARTFAALVAGDAASARAEYMSDAQIFLDVGGLTELALDEWLEAARGIDWASAEVDSRVFGATAVTVAHVAGTLRAPAGALLAGPFRYSETRVRSDGSWRIVQLQISPVDQPPAGPQAPDGEATGVAAEDDPPVDAPARPRTPPGPIPTDAYIVPRIEGAFSFDGRLDDPAWEAIEPLPVVVHFPTFMAPLSEQTEFRMAYDSEYFYFACKAHDSDVSGILAYTYERDETGFRSDFCSVYLDTLNDDENALQFKTGPLGNRSDSQRFNDGQQSDNSWNAFWDVAVSTDDEGWYTEIRIPFASLLFQSANGRVVMGISALRNISRKNERQVFPAIPPDQGQFAYTKPSLMQKVVFEGIYPQGRPTYVTPYALGGTGYSHVLNQGAGAYDRTTDRVHEGGLDVRVGVTSNLTLGLTANTDFAQVEADDQQVNLTRFSLFFPEKRRFFQERSSNFEVGLGGQDRLFHSRTVGLAGGQPVRIYGGGRLVGRIGEWDVGLLNLQTAESNALPSENLGVARLRRRVLNPNSYIGGMFTSRLGTGGHSNVVYGVDGIFRVGSADYLSFNWAQSFDDQETAPPGGSLDALDRGVARVNWERRGQDGLTYVLDLSRTGWSFDPGMGFLRQRDYTKGQANVGYGWRLAPGAALYAATVNLTSGIYRRNEDGVVETVDVEPSVVLQTWGQHQLTLAAPFSHEDPQSSFYLPAATSVPAGTYDYVAGRVQYAAPQGDRFRTQATLEGGQFFDGTRTSLSLGPVWDPSAHLNLSANYRIDRVRFAARNQAFTAHVARLRAQVMLSTATSAVGFVQYSSTDHAVIANLRVRYNPREGNDLYIVWNEGLVTDRNSFSPVRPFSTARTILVKYSHTLQLGL